jgi:hypothetical protein
VLPAAGGVTVGSEPPPSLVCLPGTLTVLNVEMMSTTNTSVSYLDSL